MNGTHEMLRNALSIALVALLAACSSERADSRVGSSSPIAASDAPRAELGLAYAATEADRRIRDAQHLVRNQPNDSASYLELANAFLDKKRRVGDPVLLAYASEALAVAESLEPNAPAALALRGVLLQEDHKFAELAELAQSLIKSAPADSTGYLLLGDAKLELGDYDGATLAYEQAMERFPDLRVYSRGAHMRWLHGDFEGAIEMMDAALESAGRSREHLAWCLTDLGQLFLRRGDAERAIAAADRAELMVAAYPPARALRGRAQHALGRHDAAAASIREALAVRASAEDHFLLADIETARGDSKAATKEASLGLALADHDPIPAAAFLARHGKDTARAVALATTELATRPTIEVQAVTALALLRAGERDRAAEAIGKALRLGTPLAELHLTGGLIKLAQGDTGGARLALETASKINPHADPRLAGELRQKLEALR